MKGKEEVHKSCLSQGFIRKNILGRKCMLMHDWSNSGCELKCGVLTEKNDLFHFCQQAQKVRNSGSLSEMQRAIPELSIPQAGRGAMCHTGLPFPTTDICGNDASALRGTKCFSCIVEGICSKHKQRTLLGVQKSAIYPFINLLIASSY